MPTMAALVATFAWRKKRSLNLWWLVLILYGGSLFGLIDHLWNRELFFISENWLKDLSLGVVITATLILAWRVILSWAKKSPALITSPRTTQV